MRPHAQVACGLSFYCFEALYNDLMKRQDVIGMMITFTVGFLAGGFLYVTHFAKLINPDSVRTQEAAEQFTIVGEAYGGCRDVCPAFQVLSDGTYRYQFYAEIGGEKQFRDGTIPPTILRNLKKVLVVEELVLQSQETDPTECNSFSDGIDIKYTITIAGAEYELNSCGTDVDGEGAVWNGLSETWSFFNTLD